MQYVLLPQLRYHINRWASSVSVREISDKVADYMCLKNSSKTINI